jgi:hypothetical protein
VETNDLYSAAFPGNSVTGAQLMFSMEFQKISLVVFAKLFPHSCRRQNQERKHPVVYFDALSNILPVDFLA